MGKKRSFITVTDQFCGAGGSSIGATSAGAELRLALNHWQLAIDIADIDFAAGRVLVRGKGDKDRNLYLLDDTVIALREWIEIRPESDTPALFVGRKGSRLGRDAAYKMIQRLAKAGGVEGIHNPHAFRHAFAVTWLQRGGDISRLQQTLGHGSSKVTLDYYATWDDRHLRDAHKDFSPHDNGGK